MQSYRDLGSPLLSGTSTSSWHTSADWVRYFEQSKRALLDIPWGLGSELTPSERRAVARSLREFQRGESSEGCHLYRYAQQYARRTGDHEYVPAIRLFIAEEQRHARDLARFLTINGIPLATSSLSDQLFRRLRHVVGTLEISVAVLITAEIIAQVYYAALHQATGSRILRRLCVQILRDEASHVHFQAEQLGKLRARRGPILHAATLALQRFLFWGTCYAVWAVHSPALRQGGYGFSRFRRTAWLHFESAFVISGAARDRWRVDAAAQSATPQAVA